MALFLDYVAGKKKLWRGGQHTSLEYIKSDLSLSKPQRKPYAIGQK